MKSWRTQLAWGGKHNVVARSNSEIVGYVRRVVDAHGALLGWQPYDLQHKTIGTPCFTLRDAARSTWDANIERANRKES